jgi:hypothetical protein
LKKVYKSKENFVLQENTSQAKIKTNRSEMVDEDEIKDEVPIVILNKNNFV